MNSSNASPVLSAQLQQVQVGQQRLLQGSELAFQAGRWVAVVGPNGAGKSTLLKVLAGLLPCSGQVQLMGRPLGQWRGRERATRLAWLGQDEPGAAEACVWDVVMLGRLPHRDWLAAPQAKDRAAVQQALQASQTWDLRERRLGELSGGERQRVLLARALAVQAPVLLMDEPLTHLDPPHQADWLALVRGLAAQGVLVLSVLHELNVALQADELLVLSHGQVQHHGRCASADSHQALVRAFGQRVAVHPVAGQWVALPLPAASA